MSISESSKHSLKTFILTAICLQNAGYSLIRKYSVAYEDVSSKEILLISEFMKMGISIYMLLADTEKTDAEGTGWRKLLWLIVHSKKMIFLSAIYGAMNILSFVALQYIGAGEFTICAQLKVLTTAGFSSFILGRSLSSAKWRALALLVMGCLLVASPALTNTHNKTDSSYLLALGYAAVLSEVVMSGFASIYFEKVVKSTTEVVSIWERNFQLCIYSILLYGSIIICESSSPTQSRMVFSGWSWISFSVAFVGAFGGLLVAATLKYADAILKTLAAGGAIVLSTILGHYFLSGPMSLVICLGAGVTIIAISNYALD